MMACDSFRARFHAQTDDAALLEHLRSCDRCLDFAASADPDVMFRALGGGEPLPPGGIDAFVGDVMRQVRVREAETQVEAHRIVSWPRRLAFAATLAAGLSGVLLVTRSAPHAPGGEVRPAVAAARTLAPVTARKLTTKPLVESYESTNATIVEVPSEPSDDDIRIVMIFDENLPADL
jgi:hypothetical protein